MPQFQMKIEMVRRSNGQYRLDHAVSKRQRTILSAFGMDDDDILSLANDISNMLTNNQSLLSETKKSIRDILKQLCAYKGVEIIEGHLLSIAPMMIPT